MFAPFYVTQEVTNKEYREFVNDILQYPDKQLSRRILYKLPTGEFKDSVSSIKYNELAKDIIDTSHLPFNDYFSNKKYDSYPVIGVPEKNIKYYAAWKSKMEFDESAGHFRILPMLYDEPGYAQKAYISSKVVLPESKQRKILNRLANGSYTGFYLTTVAPEIRIANKVN